MEKIWLKSYQSGVPADIDPDKFASINEFFETTCQRFCHRKAFANLNYRLSYRALERKAQAFATYLQTVLKLEKGERIALMMPNLLQYPVAMFGALKAGLVIVNVNPLYTPREVERQLKDAGCTIIVVLSNFASTLEQVLGKVAIKYVIITEVGDMLPFPKAYIVNWVVKHIKKMVPKWTIKNYIPFRQTLRMRIGKKYSFVKPTIQGSDIAFLQYTGGTDGIPKGTMLTHRNIVTNIEQAYAWIKPAIKLGEEIIITALPLYHIFSLTANCFTFMRIGALNVLVTNPREMHNFIKILHDYPFTAITGVNTLFNALLNHPKFAKLDFKHLKLTLGGGMSVQRSVAERWKKMTQVPLLEAYGLTETSPAVCINPFYLKEYNGSIGLPVSSTDISIRDENGTELGLNTPGELWVRGPQVMKGYWQRPEETAACFEGEWLKTGDIATVDEQGFVWIVDRKKDMILVSGFNVYPNEIEDIISLLDGVLEVAVVGFSFKGVERVKAFVVKKDPNLTKEAILQHCRQNLTAYKVPKAIEFRTELPKTNVGKILRRALRES